jgi:hypothetical protein
MHLPIEIEEMPADTVVMGDVDAFIAYVESGQALEEWQKCHAWALRELARCFRSPHRAWRPPVDGRGNAAVSAGKGRILVYAWA